MSTRLYIGTSGWHYNDWIGSFYPSDITGYHELTYHAKFFNTVENNSSFYRIASENAYKTWTRMTPDDYAFSLKLNKFITHTSRLEVTDDVVEKVRYILQTTQVLGKKMGALLIQLPASFRYDPARLETFLAFFTSEVRSKPFAFDLAIELRNKYWFTDELFALLKKYNVALVAGQSSRWPEMRHLTADIAYMRMHGPDKLFASSYTTEQLQEWAEYIHSFPVGIKRVYIYFNNDLHGYAIKNAQELQKLLAQKAPESSVAS